MTLRRRRGARINPLGGWETVRVVAHFVRVHPSRVGHPLSSSRGPVAAGAPPPSLMYEYPPPAPAPVPAPPPDPPAPANRMAQQCLNFFGGPSSGGSITSAASVGVGAQPRRVLLRRRPPPPDARCPPHRGTPPPSPQTQLHSDARPGVVRHRLILQRSSSNATSKRKVKWGRKRPTTDDLALPGPLPAQRNQTQSRNSGHFEVTLTLSGPVTAEL